LEDWDGGWCGEGFAEESVRVAVAGGDGTAGIGGYGDYVGVVEDGDAPRDVLEAGSYFGEDFVFGFIPGPVGVVEYHDVLRIWLTD